METIFWIWLAAAILFLIIEVSVTGLIFVCFFVGSIGAAVYGQFYPADYIAQTGIFAGVAILLIPLTRRLAKRISVAEGQKSNVDALVGKPAIITKEVDPVEGLGQARVEGEVWSVSAGESIPVGAMVSVESVEGTRLIVSRVVKAQESEQTEGESS